MGGGNTHAIKFTLKWVLRWMFFAKNKVSNLLEAYQSILNICKSSRSLLPCHCDGYLDSTVKFSKYKVFLATFFLMPITKSECVSMCVNVIRIYSFKYIYMQSGSGQNDKIIHCLRPWTLWLMKVYVCPTHSGYTLVVSHSIYINIV